MTTFKQQQQQKSTYISLPWVTAVHGAKSLQAKGVANENSYKQPW